MGWKTYAVAMLALQPGRAARGVRAAAPAGSAAPQSRRGWAPSRRISSFNTAVSFATNTNWQGYGGETTMSYLTQMLGLTVQNFVSAAAGMAVLVALIRGFARRSARRSATSGSISRAPRSTSCCRCRFVLALVLVSQGVVQTFAPYAKVAVIQPSAYDEPVTDQNGKPVLDAKGQAEDQEGHADRAGARGGAGRFADRDQAARHQRRRLLQRQLGASVRESDAALQLPRAAGDPADLGRALLHVRRHGRRHPAGLGGARGHDGHLRRRC